MKNVAIQAGSRAFSSCSALPRSKSAMIGRTELSVAETFVSAVRYGEFAICTMKTISD